MIVICFKVIHPNGEQVAEDNLFSVFASLGAEKISEILADVKADEPIAS